MLQQITEHTYYIPGANNLGVIATADGGAIAIDTGIDKDTGRALRKALDGAGLQLRAIISTHHHADHVGGNAFLLRNLPGVTVYAAPLEAAIIENPILEPSYLFHGARPIAALRNRWVMAPGSPVHQLLGPLDAIQRGDELRATVAELELAIIGLPGHSPAQVGISYEGVCFAADGFLGPAVLAKHGVPYAYDIDAQLASLERLASRDERFFLPGHGELTSRAELGPTLAANRAAIEGSASEVLAALADPGTVDAITGRVLRAIGRSPVGIPQYAIFVGAVAAYLSQLEGQGRARAELGLEGVVWSRVDHPAP
jgi:glyoxylase-like metal-dependent hydrolase (beta-lactamase superfamily II)